MYIPTEALEKLRAHADEAMEEARGQNQHLAAARAALSEVLEGIDTARQSFAPGSREARVLDGALAGRDHRARIILGR